MGADTTVVPDEVVSALAEAEPDGLRRLTSYVVNGWRSWKASRDSSVPPVT